MKTVADYHLLFQQYKKTTLIEQREVIANIANIMQDKPSALLCMEANPSSCHRSHLAYAVAKISNLPIQHLDKESCLKKELKESKSLLP